MMRRQYEGTEDSIYAATVFDNFIKKEGGNRVLCGSGHLGPWVQPVGEVAKVLCQNDITEIHIHFKSALL